MKKIGCLIICFFFLACKKENKNEWLVGEWEYVQDAYDSTNCNRFPLHEPLLFMKSEIDVMVLDENNYVIDNMPGIIKIYYFFADSNFVQIVKLNNDELLLNANCNSLKFKKF